MYLRMCDTIQQVGGRQHKFNFMVYGGPKGSDKAYPQYKVINSHSMTR